MHEIDIKVGKTYPIKRLKEELEKHPDIKLGHIFALNTHQYHLGLRELDALEKMMIEKEKKEEIIYDMSGKKRIDASSVIVLDIMDPYKKYEQYGKFYADLYGNIEKAIDSSSSGVVMALLDDILKEAHKETFVIEKVDDFLAGLRIFFDRKGIENRRITKDSEGKKKEFIVFGREGTITKGEKADKTHREVEKGEEKKKLITESEYDIRELKEKTKEFEHFYGELESSVIAFIKSSITKDAAIKVENIIDEAKKTIPNIEIRKDIFLKGLIQFYKEKGIDTEIKKGVGAENFMIFKMTMTQ